MKLEREENGRTLRVEGRADGTVVLAHVESDEVGFVLLDVDELRWLMTAALPALVVVR